MKILKYFIFIFLVAGCDNRDGVNESQSVDFTVSSEDIKIGQTIQFTDLSTISPTDWNWDFGDGYKSNKQNPYHTYSTAGTFDVKLTISNSFGTNVYTRKIFVSTELDSTLKAYYPFNGNVDDVSIYKQNGSMVSAVSTTDRFGNSYSSFFLNGSNSLIELGNDILSTAEEFSISVWVKINGKNSAEDGQIILDLRQHIQAYMYYFEENEDSVHYGTFSFCTYNIELSDEGIIYTENNMVKVGQWYNLIGTYKNYVQRFYIDGVLIGSINQPVPSRYNDIESYNTIGKYYEIEKNRSWSNATYDDVMIFSRELTQEEVINISSER